MISKERMTELMIVGAQRAVLKTIKHKLIIEGYNPKHMEIYLSLARVHNKTLVEYNILNY